MRLHKHKYSWAALPEVNVPSQPLEGGGVDVTEDDGEYGWREVQSRNAQAVRMMVLGGTPVVLVLFQDGSMYRYTMPSTIAAISVYQDMISSPNAWSQVGRPRLELSGVSYSRMSDDNLFIY